MEMSIGRWCLLLNSADQVWGGAMPADKKKAKVTSTFVMSLQPESFSVYGTPGLTPECM